VDILLVGPGGQGVILASDAGGLFNLSDVTLNFQDTALAGLPADSQIVGGTFKPTDFGEDADEFPAPAPAGPYATGLSVLSGQAAHGTWALYVLDDGSEDGGSIESWSLTITTVGEPVLGELTDQTAKSALGGGSDGLLSELAVLPENGVVPVPPHQSDE
jgi:hypothetical protein